MEAAPGYRAPLKSPAVPSPASPELRILLLEDPHPHPELQRAPTRRRAMDQTAAAQMARRRALGRASPRRDRDPGSRGTQRSTSNQQRASLAAFAGAASSDPRPLLTPSDRSRHGHFHRRPPRQARLRGGAAGGGRGVGPSGSALTGTSAPRPPESTVFRRTRSSGGGGPVCAGRRL